MAPFLRKYGVLTAGATAIHIPIIKRGVVDFAVGADWTPAAGDVKISLDGGAAANVTNLPTAIAMGNGAVWEFVPTAAELSCKQAVVTVSDSATKAVEDQSFIIETYGNASAMYQADLSLANLPANLVQVNASTTPVLALADFFAMMPRGTASAGASNTLTLVAPAVATGSFYLGWTLWLTGGTGAGQARLVSSYTSGRLVTVLSNWTTTPDATTTYLLTPFGQADVENWRNAAVSVPSSGAIQADLTLINANNTTTNQFLSFLLSLQRATAQAGAASTITLAATALANDSAYVGDMVIITSGTGASQARRITAYVGSTRVATVDRAWDTNPDNTSVYIIDIFANAPDANVSSINSGVDFTTAMKAATLARVTLADTTTALTNAPTAGDFTATMKTSLNAATPAVTVSDKTGFSLSVAGIKAIWDQLMSALTTTGSVGKLLADDLDATISSRTKPADTQAAVTLVATTTNLTNAPTAGDLTATMKTSVATAAQTGLTAQGYTTTRAGYMDVLNGIVAAIWAAVADAPGVTTLLSRLGAPVGASISADVAAVKADSAAIKTKTDSLAFTVAGQVDANVIDWKGATAPAMTGDAFARLGAPAGASVSADVAAVKTDTNAVATRLTSARAGYLDNLNVGGVVASQADINALNQSASRRIILASVGQFERPETGTVAYTVEARTYDGDGAAVNADTTPTLTATGIVSGSLAGNLSAATNPATGVYRWTYTVNSTDATEQVRFDVSAVLSSATFTLTQYAQVVDLVSATWTTTDASHLTSIFNKLPSKTYLTGTANSDGDVQEDEMTGGLSATAKANVNTEADTALADYDAPTHAELTAELATADDAVLAAVGALNNLSAAQVRTQADAALTAYDGPTHAEMTAELATADDAVLAAIGALNDFDPATDDVAHVILVDTTTDVTNGSTLNPTDVADAVWDAAMTDHLDSGSTGAALNAAGSAGDPWTTTLPGAYGAGTAGFIVGTNLDDPVSALPTNAELTTALGGLNNVSTAQVQTAAAAALAAYDAPTHAEMTSELATADDAVLAAISGLNDVSTTDLATALAAYDGPTHTEMTNELAALQAHGDANWEDSGAVDLTPITDVTDKLDGMIEHHTTYDRFKATALEQAPAGGGGGGSTAADIWAYTPRTLTSQTDIIFQVAPLNPLTHEMTLVEGDSYTTAINRAISFQDPNWWPTLADADSIKFYVRINEEAEDLLEVDVTSAAGPPQVVILELTSAQTALTAAHNDRYLYRIMALYGAEEVSLAYGPLVVVPVGE